MIVVVVGDGQVAGIRQPRDDAKRRVAIGILHVEWRLCPEMHAGKRDQRNGRLR